MSLAIIALAIYISIQDLRSHLITHRSLALISTALVFEYQPSSLGKFLLMVLASVALAFMTEIGGGDIKLTLALGALQGGYWLTARSAVIGSLISLALLVSHYLTGRREIALAPALLAPVMAHYLGI